MSVTAEARKKLRLYVAMTIGSFVMFIVSMWLGAIDAMFVSALCFICFAVQIPLHIHNRKQGLYNEPECR